MSNNRMPERQQMIGLALLTMLSAIVFCFAGSWAMLWSGMTVRQGLGLVLLLRAAIQFPITLLFVRMVPNKGGLTGAMPILVPLGNLVTFGRTLLPECRVVDVLIADMVYYAILAGPFYFSVRFGVAPSVPSFATHMPPEPTAKQPPPQRNDLLSRDDVLAMKTRLVEMVNQRDIELAAARASGKPPEVIEAQAEEINARYNQELQDA